MGGIFLSVKPIKAYYDSSGRFDFYMLMKG